jgi:hypothetical protein
MIGNILKIIHYEGQNTVQQSKTKHFTDIMWTLTHCIQLNGIYKIKKNNRIPKERQKRQN